jgi:hypothetical protein
MAYKNKRISVEIIHEYNNHFNHHAAHRKIREILDKL